MKLLSLGLEMGGAVLVNENDGNPLPLAPLFFRDQADGEAFLRWVGEPCGSIAHLRDLARRWARVRELPPCPTCPGGRVEAGFDQCQPCRDDAAFERALEQEDEPFENEGIRLAAEALTQ